MKKLSPTIVLITMLLLNSSFFPQSLDKITQEFYEHEINNWKEHLTASYNSTENYDVNFYHINIDIDIDNKYINGNVICRFTAKENNLSRLEFDLDSVFSIDSISGAGSYERSGKKFYVNLTRALNVNEIGEINIFYKGYPRLENNVKGLRFELQNNGTPVVASLSTPFLSHLWWPCKDGPSDKADSVYIDITIPDRTYDNQKLIAVSNGTLENIISSNGKRTFSWKERYPIVPYYVMVAISNYTTLEQPYNGAGLQFPIYYYVFKENENNALAIFDQFKSSLDLFNNYFGSYPFHKEKYAMTELGFYGGIENQTNTIINRITESWMSTIVHELAHMWFGDMITCESWHDAWLNEGFATYSTALWAEHTGGKTAYNDVMKRFEYYREGTVYLNNITDPFQIFIPIIYYKGAYVLHMLRGAMGDDNFFNAIKSYATDSTFMYKYANTQNFKEICENHYPGSLDFFFDQWIYDEYYPIYEHYLGNEIADNYKLELNQTQAELGWRPVFKMPVDIKFIFKDNTDSMITFWNSTQSQTFNFTFTKEVVDYEFDPDKKILKQDTKLDNTLSQGINISSIPNDFYLYQNYPNPFNSQTTIKYKIPEVNNASSLGKANVIIKMYDIIGNEITTLVNERKEPGIYNIILNTELIRGGLPSGVYLTVLKANDSFKTMKMILLK